MPAASTILSGVAGLQDPKPSRKQHSSVWSSTASPHWIPFIFYLAMGTFQRKAGCPADEAHNVGSCSQDEDTPHFTQGSQGSLGHCRKRAELLPWKHQCYRDGSGLLLLLLALLYPGRMQEGAWAEGRQREHFSRCQTTARLVLKHGLWKVH